MPPPMPIREEKPDIKKPNTEQVVLSFLTSLRKKEKCRLKNIFTATKPQNKAKTIVTKSDLMKMLRQAPQIAPVIKDGSHLRKAGIFTS